MESKEINKAKSTLTQGTMSRTVFPSFRIFLLSLSFPGDCRIRFSDAPSVYICFFVFVLVAWISLLSNFFFAGVFWFLPYAYQFLLLEIHLPASLSYSDKDDRKFLPWNNFWKFVQESMIYYWKSKCCWKILFQRSLLISISEWSLSWLSLSFYAFPFP